MFSAELKCRLCTRLCFQLTFCCSNVCTKVMYMKTGLCFVVIPGCMRYSLDKGPRINQSHCSKCYSYALKRTIGNLTLHSYLLYK